MSKLLENTGYNLQRPFADRKPGGTRKIADLRSIEDSCRAPAHNPPSMMVYTDGLWEHTCPTCGESQRFVVAKPRLLLSRASAWGEAYRQVSDV